jgi:hypothetical protein
MFRPDAAVPSIQAAGKAQMVRVSGQASSQTTQAAPGPNPNVQSASVLQAVQFNPSDKG